MYNDYQNQQNLIGLTASCQKDVMYQPPTARRQLEEKKSILQAELARVDAAMAALDAHPELEAFTETLKAALR